MQKETLAFIVQIKKDYVGRGEVVVFYAYVKGIDSLHAIGFKREQVIQEIKDKIAEHLKDFENHEEVFVQDEKFSIDPIEVAHEYSSLASRYDRLIIQVIS